MPHLQHIPTFTHPPPSHIPTFTHPTFIQSCYPHFPPSHIPNIQPCSPHIHTSPTFIRSYVLPTFTHHPPSYGHMFSPHSHIPRHHTSPPSHIPTFTHPPSHILRLHRVMFSPSSHIPTFTLTTFIQSCTHIHTSLAFIWSWFSPHSHITHFHTVHLHTYPTFTQPQSLLNCYFNCQEPR